MQEEELGPGFDLTQKDSKKKKKFRLILLHVSENHWFNSSMCGTHPCAIPHLSYTHRTQLQQRTVFRCTPASHSGQRTFPFLFPGDYFRYSLFKKTNCNYRAAP